MGTGQTDFDVTMGLLYYLISRLRKQGYFQGVYCNTETIVYTQFVVLQYIQKTARK